MKEIGSSSPASTMNSERKHKTTSFGSRLKKNCLLVVASLQEGLTYVKAFFIGQTKMIKARNEEEASVAELETEKMQVAAADAAEATKTKLNKSL
ncbi:uncharacterized protein LOC114757258 [Neltuma alba]|uniref:uncharacterized protein LOC114738735 n=1 Tax=Neltuma alba TaxID=207710 RepID=UPI0010A4E52F|nr:uncharacterized protein LOC114738735 [Prosopis alba]XP_028802085.1 uncharacterized protein LOC114757258 [Prosopis alba]